MLTRINLEREIQSVLVWGNYGYDFFKIINIVSKAKAMVASLLVLNFFVDKPLSNNFQFEGEQGWGYFEAAMSREQRLRKRVRNLMSKTDQAQNSLLSYLNFINGTSTMQVLGATTLGYPTLHGNLEPQSSNSTLTPLEKVEQLLKLNDCFLCKNTCCQHYSWPKVKSRFLALEREAYQLNQDMRDLMRFLQESKENPGSLPLLFRFELDMFHFQHFDHDYWPFQM